MEKTTDSMRLRFKDRLCGERVTATDVGYSVLCLSSAGITGLCTTPDPAENTLGKLLLVLTGQASILNTKFGHMDALSQ